MKNYIQMSHEFFFTNWNKNTFSLASISANYNFIYNLNHTFDCEHYQKIQESCISFIFSNEYMNAINYFHYNMR